MKIVNLSLLMFCFTISYLSHADGLFYGESEEMGDASSSTSSKREEELLNTPLSISIVTAEQIKNAGITTIAESMKLVPGAIVREQTNGQFDVQLRGMESLVTGATLTSLNNRKTLIMIDNRVVFDYFSGGIFWDTLPISVEDVDRIEVVRGAVSSLYGANALTGVIHIFTKRAKGDASAKASLMLGSNNSLVTQLVAEKNMAGIYTRLTGLVEKRDRYQDEYFSFADGEYQNSGDITLSVTEDLHDHSERAVEKNSFMLSMNNDPLNLFNYDLTIFHQESDTQKVHINSNDIPFTDNLSNTDGFNLKLNYGELTSRLSYNFGKQETVGFPDFTYDTEVSQASVGYQLRFPKWVIQPGVDWYKVSYEGAFIGGKRSIIETNYMLRLEYNPEKDWRIISALNYADFNAPKTNNLNYQLMTTYQWSFDTSVRASIQSASASAFMVNQYTDLEFVFPNDPSQRVDVKGDKNGRLNRITSYEFGIRKQLDFNNLLELELYHSQMDNFTQFVIKPPVVVDGQTITERSLEDIPQQGMQDGLTLNWNYEADAWDINTFVSWQRTKVNNQTESLLISAEIKDEYNELTPRVYGGINLNWQFAKSYNLNLLSNYLSEHTFDLQQPQGSKTTPAALYSNLTLNYQYNQKISAFAGIKNLSDQDESQHFYTDRLEAQYWLGFNIKFY